MPCLPFLSIIRRHNLGPLNGYLDKETTPKFEKPKICRVCDYFQKENYCRLNAMYGIKEESKACFRAIPIQNKRGLHWYQNL